MTSHSKQHTQLSPSDWGKRLKARPGARERFQTAGEEALLSVLEGRRSLKQAHGVLQFIRHWWLSNDYDLVSREEVLRHLKELGAEFDLRDRQGDEDIMEDVKFGAHRCDIGTIPSNYRVWPKRSEE